MNLATSKKAMVSVSVVVPVRNAVKTLPYCLTGLRRLNPQPVEIILVDNVSTDGSSRLVEEVVTERSESRFRVVREQHRGASAARNAGIRAAEGEVVAFTDADCVPDPGWLRHLTSPFVDSQVGAVAGRVIAAPAGSILELFSALYTLQMPNRPSRHQRWMPGEGGFPTANLAVRRCLLQEIKGFDQTVDIYGEDYDLCARLYDRRAEIAYIPEAQVAHHHRTTIAGMVRQAFGFGRSHPYLVRRHLKQGLWLELPFRSISWSRFPFPAWIDLASADKKAFAVVALGTAYTPAFFLLPLFAAWLTISARRRAQTAGISVSSRAAITLAALLVLKSSAMTAGRWWGSVKYGALCL